MVERVPQHKHCANCDKAIPYKDKFCDDTCEKEHKGKMAKKKRELYFYYAVMIIIFMMAMATIYLGGF